MWKSIDIGRVLKLLLVVAVSMFMLTACASDDKNPDTSRAAVKGDVDEQSIAQDQATCWQDSIQDSIIELLYDNMGKVAMGTYNKICLLYTSPSPRDCS